LNTAPAESVCGVLRNFAFTPCQIVFSTQTVRNERYNHATGGEHMSKEAKLELDGKTCTLPVIVGSEGEKAVDVSSLRANTGYITLDDGYSNTGSCLSQITFIDGDKGILRYRGIPI